MVQKQFLKLSYLWTAYKLTNDNDVHFVFFVDLKGAFDTIAHSGLLHVLNVVDMILDVGL